MNKKTLLIIDDNRHWCEIVKNEAERRGCFHVCDPLHNGRDAIEFIGANKPGIIVLDLLLPELDGLYIINHIKKEMTGYKPFIYVVSTIGSTDTARIMNSLDVSYYSIKPILEKAVISNLCDFVCNLEESPVMNIADAEIHDTKSRGAINLDKILDDYLHELGAPLYRISTQCLHNTLKHCLLDESKLSNFTELFKLAASEMSPPMKYAAFERNVRWTAKTLEKNPTPFFNACFPDKSKKMTTTLMIDTSVYLLRAKIEEALGD